MNETITLASSRDLENWTPNPNEGECMMLQPMETAPKDSRILLLVQEAGQLIWYIGEWRHLGMHAGYWWAAYEQTGGELVEPMGWHPLPVIENE